LPPWKGEVKSTSGPKSAIDAVFNGLVQPHDPGIAVLIRQGEKDSFQETYGIRDLRSKAKIDAHTNFSPRLLHQAIHAMAVMLLVHDGKLRYDQTLTGIFPDFPAYGKAINIRNLLNHTSASRTTKI